MTKSSLARASGVAAALLAGGALALAAPLAASAHVRVNPAQAEAGSYTTLTFKVPNESATASTTSVTVDLPTDTPFTSVSYQPVPGWTTEIVTGTLPEPVTAGSATITEAPVSVTWTAVDGVGIADGQFQEFPLSVGPVPDVGSIALPAHQAYSDGSVVDWDEATPDSGEEPESPAPVLYVNDAPPTGEHGHGATAMSATAGESAGGADAAADDTASVASVSLGLGIGAIVLAAAALVVVAVGAARGSRGSRGSRGTRGDDAGAVQR
ncbi:YcnI family protein [Herbiconiux sp. KACC 21604]|uniref:YcnI family copper-binding membrane protein n=1 Tax=unclassified Herbiconiux TaxID=2618217 RepID=UPI001492284E|nr:YcnI family protein [Herbiconiux sp. SALV-R1]QJU55403.1 YcnI family protein [Herbiconiux sp. SALV-R1]WPO86578.1 YcnI family protein [Herbiconiux sp. KACC 21604]